MEFRVGYFILIALLMTSHPLSIVELQPTSHNDLAHKIVYENY